MSSRHTLEIRGTRKAIAELLTPNPEITDVMLYAKPSKRMLFAMLNALPNLKRITVGKGIARQISKRQMEALDKVGIEVILEDRKRGRKPMFSAEQRKAIMEEFARDPSSMAKYGIGRRAVYYWMKK
jgi:hypothetical protein